jgi:NAD(P)-dependent dehydrogenase (short-subunit alcohol dehydrogenase family)
MSHGRFDNPVVAALAGFWDLFRKQDYASRLTDNDRADGKTCLITGANSGLGFGLAVEMAKRGAHVIMAGRSHIPEAGEKVKKLSGSDKVEMRYLDLSKIETIHEFCDGLKQDDILLDITIFNAATALAKARRTDSGLEEMFLVNVLSNTILATLLLNKGIIDRSGTTSFLPRILYISSDSHQGSSHVDYEEFGKYHELNPSKAISNYSYFKLVVNTYMTELSRRLNKDVLKVSVNIICPGPVASNITKEAPFLLRVTLNAIFKVIFRSPKKAALPVVYMAITPDYEGKTNQYQHMFKPKKMDPKVYEEKEGFKLWEESYTLWKEVDPEAEELS